MARIVKAGTFTAMQPLVVKKVTEAHRPQKGGLPPVMKSSCDVLADVCSTGYRAPKEKDGTAAKGRGWNTECHRGFYDGFVKSSAF